MPVVDDNTYKYWIAYESGGLAHEMLIRLNENATVEATAATYLQNIVNAMLDAMWSNDAVTGARYSTPGATFSLPYSITGGAGSVTPGTSSQESNASFAALSARSTGGVRYTIHFFTQVVVGVDLYRAADVNMPADVVSWKDIVKAGNGSVVPRAVDGLPLIWHDYWNNGQNAYWQRAQR